MASVFLHHVVRDLTLGKPEFVEFSEAETLAAAVRAIAECPEGAVPVWRKRQPATGPVAAPSSEYFVGMLNSLDVAAFLARAGRDHASAMRTPVSEVVVPNRSMLKELDPSARLLDALEMMKNGARCLLVRKSLARKGTAKHFSTPYNCKSFKIAKTMSTNTANSRSSSTSPPHNDVCCLYREDVVRFLIGCLGALAPIPLASISSIGAFNPHYSYVEASSSALEAISRTPHDPCAIAVVETNSDGSHKILGDISAEKLWKCDYMAAAWALANFSARQFAVGIDEDGSSPIPPHDHPVKPRMEPVSVAASPRSVKFSSRSVGFVENHWNKVSMGRLRSMHRGKSKPLTCKHTSSLAAVMAQMLSHRANHIWVIDSEWEEDVLVGVVSYTDILDAVVKHPSILLPPTP